MFNRITAGTLKSGQKSFHSLPLLFLLSVHLSFFQYIGGLVVPGLASLVPILFFFAYPFLTFFISRLPFHLSCFLLFIFLVSSFV